MPRVMMNDKPVDTQMGERLLDAARREGVHIGFVCDGKGLCQTCECRILSGSEHLSPPNDIEKVWLTESQLEEDRRLACQTSLRGPGPVELLTRAEHLRRLAMNVIAPPPDTIQATHVGNLFTAMLNNGLSHLSRWPTNMVHIFSNARSTSFSLDDARTYFDDTGRVTNTMISRQEKPSDEQR